MRSVVILYHAECTDGFTAAWVAWKKFGSRADYLPIFHSTPVLKGLTGKEIYFLDIVYPMPILKKLIAANKKVVVIDHHITRSAEAKAAGGSYALNHSGAALAWQYFFPKKLMPLLVKLVEEEDLWRFKSRNVKEILAAVKLQPFNFQAWSQVAAELENPKKRFAWVAIGKTVLAYQQKLIAELCRSANLVEFEGYKTYAVNSAIFKSEIGNFLFTKRLPPIGIVWSVQPNHISISLRSNGKVDVAKLCEQYGGGGHKAAAGFSLPLSAKLPWRYLGKS